MGFVNIKLKIHKTFKKHLTKVRGIYYTLKAMNIWSRGQVVKTPPFHGGIRGSSPLEITKKTG